MATIKVKTNQAHRFNRVLNIKGTEVKVDSEGVAEVPEKLTIYALAAGFELVDKNAKFSTEEEQNQSKEVQAVIKAAEAKAKAIIAEAETKAKAIIAEAEAKAKTVIVENKVDEKEAKRQELLSMTNDMLKAALDEAKVDSKLWKEANKETLVDLIMQIVFEEKGE